MCMYASVYTCECVYMSVCGVSVCLGGCVYKNLLKILIVEILAKIRYFPVIKKRPSSLAERTPISVLPPLIYRYITISTLPRTT